MDPRPTARESSVAPRSPATRVALSLGVVVAAGTLGLGLATTWDARTDTVESLVVGTVRLAGLAVCAWYAVAALLTAATLTVEAAGGTWSAGRLVLARWGPRLLRRVAGVGAVAGVSLAALASPSAAAVPVNLTTGVAAAADPGSVQPATTARSEVGPPGAEQDRPMVRTVPGAGGVTERPTAAPQGAGSSPTADQVDRTSAPADVVEPAASAAPDESDEVAAAVEATDVPHRQLKATAVVTPPAATVAGAGAADASTTVAATGPDRDVSAPAAPPEIPAATYTVRPGDSLWLIAGGDTDQGGTTWLDWYDANAAAIGPDPDLIHPGTVLTVPATPSPSASEAEPEKQPEQQPENQE